MTDTIDSSMTAVLEAAPGRALASKIASDELASELLARFDGDALSLVGPGGLLGELTKRVLEAALEGEMTEHVGYECHDRAGHHSGNNRNGTRPKTVITDIGPIDIDVPRDRNGTFQPVIVPKRKRRLGGVDQMVLSLSAKGLTHGEICAHLEEIYGAKVSKETITRITDQVIETMVEWQNRPLDAVYPVMFIDAIHVKIRDGQVANRPIYVAIGVTVDGERDILGLWIGDGGEGAKYWAQVLTEIKNRGTKDVCILVCDGLTGLPDAVNSVWPQTIVQACVVHLIRASFRYASRRDWPELARTSSRSTRRRPRRPPWSVWPTSPASGKRSIRPLSRCGRARGPSSCRSWPSTPRSARSFTPLTPSSRSTPGSERRSRPGVISPMSRRRSSACTWPS